MSDAWVLADGVGMHNSMEENRMPGADDVPMSALFALRMTAKTFPTDEISATDEGFIGPLLADLGYSHYDVITIDVREWGEEKFAQMAQMHFAEHIHEDDEVRLILEGGGYFDIRSADDRWLRVETNAGDCIVVPAGMYHRFATKPDRYTKALRLFKENPRWEAVPRGPAAEATAARRNYLELLKRPATVTENANLLLRAGHAKARAEEKHKWKVHSREDYARAHNTTPPAPHAELAAPAAAAQPVMDVPPPDPRRYSSSQASEAEYDLEF